MKVDIIIVKYGQPKLEEECIESVRQYTSGADSVVHAYDNFVSDRPLAAVWNEVIDRSECGYICLLNNDTRVERNWLPKLLEVFETHPDAGIVGPVTNHAAGVQGRKSPGMPYRVHATNMMSGFCMVFKKALWAHVGGFDEEFELYGEDSDFCREVLLTGKKLYVRDDVFIFHHGAQGTPVAKKRGKDIDAIRRRSSQRYTRKWARK